MSESFEDVYSTLTTIYNRHRRKYRNHHDTKKQMCLMWPTDDLPDTLVDTEPIYDMIDAFDIDIDELAAVELYDMDLDEAARRIIEIQKSQEG